jgi:hypothetical protein
MSAPPLTLAAVLLSLLAAPRLRAQGPPFQTDDPVPVDLHHYEFYIFSAADATPVERDFTGPAFEFNWGAIPRVQLHAVLPWGVAAPANNPAFLPSGAGPTAFGLTDAEFGTKIAFYEESKSVPQIGIFPMLELPTGNSDKGLGVGKAWVKAPVWLQKNIGKWLLDGGAGYSFVSQTGYRNFAYGGFLVKYSFGERLELGGELFSHGAEGDASPQVRGSTMVDFGGYYHFRDPNKQLLFCYGHSVGGLTENYAYVGMYWTWGKDSDRNKSSPGGPGGFLAQQATRYGRR